MPEALFGGERVILWDRRALSRVVHRLPMPTVPSLVLALFLAPAGLVLPRADVDNVDALLVTCTNDIAGPRGRRGRGRV